MNVSSEFVNGIQKTTYEVQIQDMINQKMEAYALLMFMLSSAILVYVLWNNFVRSPSKKKGLKESIFNENGLICDEGIEPSNRVKRISRAMDEYIIVPALVMFYISFSYYNSI